MKGREEKVEKVAEIKIIDNKIKIEIKFLSLSLSVSFVLFNFLDDRITIYIVILSMIFISIDGRWGKAGNRRILITLFEYVLAEERYSSSFFFLSLLFFFSPLRLPWLHWNASKINRTTKEKRFCFFQWKYRVQVRTGRTERVVNEGRKPRARIIRSNTYVFRSKKTNVCKIGRHFSHECLPIHDIVIPRVYRPRLREYINLYNLSTSRAFRR